MDGLGYEKVYARVKDGGKKGNPPRNLDEATYSRKGYDRLWHWFSVSYASWLTVPRIMMHEMPDEWQDKMAELMEEWDDTWDSSELPSPSVTARDGNRFTKWPQWVLNYRRPDREKVLSMKRK